MYDHFEMFKKFKSFGISSETLRLMVTSDIKDIDNEPAEEMVIVKAIKNAGPDKKA